MIQCSVELLYKGYPHYPWDTTLEPMLRSPSGHNSGLSILRSPLRLGKCDMTSKVTVLVGLISYGVLL